MIVRNGERLGSVLVDKASTEPVPQPEPEPSGQLTETEQEADRQAAEARESLPEQLSDGVHAVGGGWHEVVIGGDVIEKIRGADAAQEAYEAYQQSEPNKE